jgi:hypothetical protein
MVGLQYDQFLANTHFTLFFIGVNITFFPLHFLGLSGMPRRINDHPDFYMAWNELSTIGSSISLVATLIFLFVVFDMFVFGLKGRKAPYTIKFLTKMELLAIILKKNYIKNFFINTGVTFNDSPNKLQFGFQDPGTSIMEAIVDLHHDIMFFLIWVVSLVSYLMLRIITQTNINLLDDIVCFLHLVLLKKDIRKNPGLEWKKASEIMPPRIQHNTLLETVWTVVPCLILLSIALPSFSLLYAIEDLNIIEMTIKIVGNQWFWTYEIPYNSSEINFDSVMIDE